MIPLAIPSMGPNEARYLQQCVETNFVSSVGPFVTRLESMVAEQTGSAAAIATCTGTAGLHAALAAVGVGRDDLVILPSLTFIASANAIAYCGAEPWLLDVEPESWTLDPEQVARALATESRREGDALVHVPSGRRIAAMMPVHTLGLPAAMDELTRIARDHGVPTVADAAAALGATAGGRRIGELGADLGVLSFNGNKTVTAGGGGAVFGRDDELCARVRHLTTTARTGRDYTHDQIGFNYRMTNLQAAVGCAQLERADALVAAKRRIAARYRGELEEVDGIGPFPAPPGRESACWFSGFVLEDNPGDRLFELIDALRAKEIDARPFWKPVHLQAPFAAAPRGSLACSEGLWRRIVTLPCSTALSDDDQAFVIDAVRAIVPGFVAR